MIRAKNNTRQGTGLKQPRADQVVKRVVRKTNTSAIENRVATLITKIPKLRSRIDVKICKTSEVSPTGRPIRSYNGSRKEGIKE